MILERFEVPGLAQYSYMVGDGGVVAVIDPKRDIDTYLSYADSKGLRIAYVVETHIHADFASGARALAAAAGAELGLSAYDRGESYQYGFAHKRLTEGDELPLGKLVLRTLHTPGHTPEHIGFLLKESGQEQPLALFSGDFLFVGAVGRPDLLGEAEKQDLARSLFNSVQALQSLPDGLLIFPGHGAGSLCGAGLSQRQQSTLGYERATNPFLQMREEHLFIRQVLETVPEFPDYYRRMKRINAEGPTLLAELPGELRLPVDTFGQKLAELDALVLDLRRPEAFGGAHIPGSYNIGAGPNLSTWAAWVLPYDRPILLVGESTTEMDAVRRSLIRVGHDGAIGSLRGGIGAWLESGRALARVPQVSVGELKQAMDQRPTDLLDVRNPEEWHTGHVQGAVHLPAGQLRGRMHELPAGNLLYVMCGSGYRSSVAISVLMAEGFVCVTNVAGGMGAWRKQNLPEVRQ